MPHPRSVNHVTLGNLLRESQASKVQQFLCKDLSGVSPAVAAGICTNTSITDRSPRNLSSSEIAALCQQLRDDKGIKDPSATCLSPAGEYNLRLGVIKELRPNMVATFTEKPGAHEGHPFMVEAAVSLGGASVREGINVYRFANRIPLLFEVGADVVTRVATSKINWSQYHIDQKKDNVGVYVSIVSTRIPFKGTSKEYIGEDVTEMQVIVKKAIMACCQQLKVNLAARLHKRDEQERKKTLVKYIPDISNALLVVLKKMGDAEAEAAKNGYIKNKSKAKSSSSSSLSTSSSSALGNDSQRAKLVQDVMEGKLTETSLKNFLVKAVDRFEEESSLQVSLRLKGIFLYTVGILCNVERCIR